MPKPDPLSEWLSHNPAFPADDNPNYYASNPQDLITTSQPLSFSVGTGQQLFSSILDTCLSTQRELILVTCFWAKSCSQRQIYSFLLALSSRAVSEGRKIQVRLCLSSLSLLQKLFHTRSPNGKIIPPAKWGGMGLPKEGEISGVQMVVKSIFIQPFSVMHPKFVIMDRERAFMPSCNVSWEDWFEGCIEMRGDIVAKLFEFWETFWGLGRCCNALLRFPEHHQALESSHMGYEGTQSRVLAARSFSLTPGATHTVLLPSPHHVNPHFRPFGIIPPPPVTPLNTFILGLINGAKPNTEIYMQTPNLTCRPVLSAILSALTRGIHFHIIVSRQLMILEQLVTAGTTTERCISKLQTPYYELLRKYDQPRDEEARIAMVKPGNLKIGYFMRFNGDPGEPVKSHLKCTILNSPEGNGESDVTVLGSGNMDRASWYTSQELGVAFVGRQVAKDVRECIEKGLQGRVEYVD